MILKRNNMKYKILILGLLFSFFSFSQNQKITDKDLCNGILYKLPSKAHNTLYEKLKEKEYKSIYLELSKQSDVVYRIYIHEYISSDVFIEKTNKYIIISDIVYPLVLTTDYTFGVKQSPKEILEQIKKNGEYMTTSLGIIKEFSDYIEFDIRD